MRSSLWDQDKPGANPIKRVLEKNTIFWRKICQLFTHKFVGRNLRQNFQQKTSFYLIFSNENSFIGLKKSFDLIMPTPKFLRWVASFIGLAPDSNKQLIKISKKKIYMLDQSGTCQSE